MIDVRIRAVVLCLTFLPALARAQPLQFGSNGHYYEFIPGSFSFQAALADASGRTFQGSTGHLVTITSQAENDFLATTFVRPASFDFVWIAGSDEASEGDWIWVAGPEIGVQFSFAATPTAPDNFAPWGTAEPNNNNGSEHYAGLNIGDQSSPGGTQPGEWGDTHASAAFVGYVVEFSDAATAISTLSTWFYSMLALLLLTTIILVLRARPTTIA